MKARDIIPGWPRGRSTSRPIQYSRKIAAFFATERFFISEAPFFDHALAAREWAEVAAESESEQAEERRKADMMEVWYESQRIEARGSLRPETSSESLIRFCPDLYPLGFSPELIRYWLALQRVTEEITGLYKAVQP